MRGGGGSREEQSVQLTDIEGSDNFPVSAVVVSAFRKLSICFLLEMISVLLKQLERFEI